LPEADFRFVNVGRYASPQAFQAAIGPPPAAKLDASVTQLHSADYRNPEALPEGPVLDAAYLADRIQAYQGAAGSATAGVTQQPATS
jgi:hypothetical protein